MGEMGGDGDGIRVGGGREKGADCVNGSVDVICRSGTYRNHFTPESRATFFIFRGFDA